MNHTTPVPSGQPCVCDGEGVCVLPCAAPLFLLTCVVIFRDFSPCCHITIPHWNALILSLVQQPCGDWANIELRCHRKPASLRERQDVVLYCSWSQHKIKLEQTVKCMCVCVLAYILTTSIFSTTVYYSNPYLNLCIYTLFLVSVFGACWSAVARMNFSVFTNCVSVCAAFIF